MQNQSCYDALTYKARAFIEDRDGVKLGSGGSLKILGFHLDSRPTCHAHVEALHKKVQETVWVLCHLKTSCFNEKKLVTVYKTVVRLVLDYWCVVYRLILTDEQDQIVERLQAQTHKTYMGTR